MRLLCFLFVLTGVHSYETLTTLDLLHVEDMDHVAAFGDAEHRGDKWVNFDTSSSGGDESYMNTGLDESASSISTSFDSLSSSSDGSSEDTKERRRATQKTRLCTPCPKEMLKRHDNAGIKWICGGYQRARRSFKSECMMRFRNCQDGTMFVRLYAHRCKTDFYHGRHWFYVYDV